MTREEQRRRDSGGVDEGQLAGAPDSRTVPLADELTVEELVAACAAIAADLPSGAVPTYGSPAWLALPARDPRRMAALWRAAEAWRRAGTAEAIAGQLRHELGEVDALSRYRIRVAGLDLHQALTGPRQYDQLDEHIERRLGPPTSLLRAATDVNTAELERRRAEVSA